MPISSRPDRSRACARRALFTLALFVPLAIGACKADEPSPSHAKASESAAPSAPAASHVELVEAPPDADVLAMVEREAARAKADGRDLVVYVGAPWCEPCQRFHHAAIAGALDEAFPTLRLVLFDLQRDGEKLAAAGYVSQMIPLFAVPRPDGRASGLQIEGSIKGDGAVAQIAPRLRQLLAEARAGR